MKTLLLMRHAKSSWSDASLADHDRPLKSRGERASRRMGQLLQDEQLHPEVILCSTAVRARATWEGLATTCEQFSRTEVRLCPNLYHCPWEEFPRTLATLDQVETVLLIGHNPGLEDWLRRLIGREERLPTAALARLSVELTTWSSWQSQSPEVCLENLWRPRDLDA